MYSEADFEVFRPAGATHCTDAVKFGVEEKTFGPLLHAQFHPHRCNDKGKFFYLSCFFCTETFTSAPPLGCTANYGNRSTALV